MTAPPAAKVLFEDPLRIVEWSEAADGGRGGFIIEWEDRPNPAEYTAEPWRKVLGDDEYKAVLAAFLKTCAHQQVSAAKEKATIVSCIENIVTTLEQRAAHADRMWRTRHGEHEVQQILDQRRINFGEYVQVQYKVR